MNTSSAGHAPTSPRVLVIGLGSIGRRHVELLRELGCEVAVVTQQVTQEVTTFSELGAALELFRPDRVLIANRTIDHYPTLQRLQELSCHGKVLGEKPLFSELPEALTQEMQQRIVVGYNLRFHPVIQALRNSLVDEEPVSAQIYCGQYLPTWRPGSDYRQSYSAFREQGGGVLRDLSHELDLALWLFGPWKKLVAHGGQLSELELQSEDTVGLWLESARCRKVGVEINYLDRVPRRFILVHTRRHTWEADVVGGRLLCDGQVVQSWKAERNFTYRAQDQDWLTDNPETLCSCQEGLAVLHLIKAAENSLATQSWMFNPLFTS